MAVGSWRREIRAVSPEEVIWARVKKEEFGRWVRVAETFQLEEVSGRGPDAGEGQEAVLPNG